MGRGTANERMEALLAAHEHAFEHFDGHTAEILYDRMRHSDPVIVLFALFVHWIHCP